MWGNVRRESLLEGFMTDLRDSSHDMLQASTEYLIHHGSSSLPDKFLLLHALSILYQPPSHHLPFCGFGWFPPSPWFMAAGVTWALVSPP
jgi:hypothetical protein